MAEAVTLSHFDHHGRSGGSGGCSIGAIWILNSLDAVILSRRAVRVNSQLKSHKRFANAFLTYCQLVDNARLYCMNALEGPPKVCLDVIVIWGL
nr:hypothetical protein CFP56_64305 [Quercus suber]